MTSTDCGRRLAPQHVRDSQSRLILNPISFAHSLHQLSKLDRVRFKNRLTLAAADYSRAVSNLAPHALVSQLVTKNKKGRNKEMITTDEKHQCFIARQEAETKLIEFQMLLRKEQ